MGKLEFDSNGRLMRADKARDLKIGDYTVGKKKANQNFEAIGHPEKELKNSSSLEFLKEDSGIQEVFSKDYWSLYAEDKRLEPLKFTNGKTQEDVVKEVVELSKDHKVIFIHGTCGSGKSAIALNIGRALGRASIVVPVKALQRQYEEDYITKKYLRKANGKKMKIAMITGRDNHDSIINPGKSCADPLLPENIKITEKNSGKIMEYVKENPFISNPENLGFEHVRRMTIAVANPYWSPTVPADYELKAVTNTKKRRYKGVNGKEHVFYHRKNGCSYYDQYLGYTDADVIMFNSAKYKAEMSLGRKPMTDVDIIDEADEFLDEFFQQDELNLSRLLASARGFYPESNISKKSLDKIKKLIELEEQNKRALGIREDQVFHISETKIKEILEEFNMELQGLYNIL